MRHQKSMLGLAVALMAAGPGAASAEDIDIFLTDPSITAGRPNVLLMLDNAANNNSNITLLNGSSGDKLEMLRQVLNNIVDPLNSPFFPACTITSQLDVNGILVETRTPADCVTRNEVNDLLNGINLGLMIANPSGSTTGGYVRSHVRAMSSSDNRTALLGKINPGIPQANNAPYAKTMHEAYLYFGGKPAFAGFSSSLYDPAARSGANYVSPAAGGNCADNYIIFVGNGGPDSGENKDARALLNGIGGVLPTDPVPFNPSNFTSNWFDEYARTLKRQDVTPNAAARNVTTYTIAVQNPDANNFNTNPERSARELLKSGATLGGGEYFEAHNGQMAMRAFVNILQKMQPVNSVFAAVTLPVSVNVRGAFLNQVYMGQFRPDGNARPRWPGNLKAYQIALDVNGNPILADRFGAAVEDTVKGFILPDRTSFWTTDSAYWTFNPMGVPSSASDAPDGSIVEKGGVAQRLRTTYATSQSARRLFTCNGACGANAQFSSTPFATTNSSMTAAMLGAANATERDNIINWVRGQDNRENENQNKDASGNPILTDVRARIHGDLLHSRPAVVNYNRNGDDRDIMIYYGTNGGVFHAVKGGLDNADGVEKWGIVFPEFLGRLKRLRDNSPDISSGNPKPYFADGPVSVYQRDTDGDGRVVAASGDKVYLFIGMRRGGRFIYALDVSDPDEPRFLWKVDPTVTGFAELGQSWSTPWPARINAVDGDPVVIFGAGYDPAAEDQLPAGTTTMGRGVFVVNGRTGARVAHINPEGMGSVPADVTVVDRNKDGFADRIYTADTKGNIWRSDIHDPDPANWQTYRIASLGGTGAAARKFLNKPDVVFGSNYDVVLIGSGDREKPFDTTVLNRFYMIKDSHTGLNGAPSCTSNGLPTACAEGDLTDVTNVSSESFELPSTSAGWFLTLQPGEKVVGNALTVFGTTFFGTNRPTPPAPGECSSNLGEARLYALRFDTGTAARDLNADSLITPTDRSIVIAGGGYLPSPVYAPVMVEEKKVDTICIGPHCLNPGGQAFGTARTRTFWHLQQQ